MSVLQTSDLVRPIGDDLRNAFFRVLAVSRNGWATCVCVAYADGQRPWCSDYSFTPKFRVRELKRVDALPPLRFGSPTGPGISALNSQPSAGCAD